MIIFAASKDSAHGEIEPLLKAFNDEVVLLVPKISNANKSKIPLSEDLSLVEKATAVIITGGPLTDWTVDIAMRSKEAGIPVHFLETSMLNTERVVPHNLGDLVEHAFCGSPISKLAICDEMGIVDQKVSVIGYPLLDTITKREESSDIKIRSLLVALDDSVNEKQAIELLSLSRMLQSLGYVVTVRVANYDNSGGESKDLSISKGSLDEELLACDGVIGMPGLLSVAAYAAGKPVWHIKSHVNDSNKLYAKLSSPIEDTMDPESSLFAPDMRNKYISEHIAGPLDGRAGERLRVLLMLSELG